MSPMSRRSPAPAIGPARPSIACRTIMSPNGAIMTATSRGRPVSIPSRQPNIRARCAACRSRRSAIAILMRPRPASPTAGRSPISRKGNWANLAHCYGSVGVGRGLAPDTGTGRRTLRGHRPWPAPARPQHRAGRAGDRGDRAIEHAAARDRGARLLQGQSTICADRAGPDRRRHAGGGAARISR